MLLSLVILGQFPKKQKNQRMKELSLGNMLRARIIDEVDGKYIGQAEVFGEEIDMWLRSKGDKITILTED